MGGKLDILLCWRAERVSDLASFAVNPQFDMTAPARGFNTSYFFAVSHYSPELSVEFLVVFYRFFKDLFLQIFLTRLLCVLRGRCVRLLVLCQYLLP